MAVSRGPPPSSPFPSSYVVACLLLLLLLLLVPTFAGAAIIRDTAEEAAAVYLVQVEGDEPVAFHHKKPGCHRGDQLLAGSGSAEAHAKHLVELHDRLLQASLPEGTYRKLYSFHHILNGFAVHTTPSQAARLAAAPGVTLVERDPGAKLMTTHTPAFLGLPAAWARGAPRGRKHLAGEGIVIGVVDTGIDPAHPSFAYDPAHPYRPDWSPRWFSGAACEAGPSFAVGSCNGKIVAARHFSAGAAAAFHLNASRELSPLDEVGHGTHVASIAAGNWGVPVVVDGFKYGTASGMAPRARIAVYKAIYPEGGTLADVVSAIDQAARDGVDILVLSVGPEEPPRGDIPTLLSMFEISMLFARRAGIFVAQAAGNRGPGEATVASVSPWVTGVAAATTDRRFRNTLILGDGIFRLPGVGLSGPTSGHGRLQFKLVAARDAVAERKGFPASYAEECQHPDALQPATVEGAVVVCNFSTGFLNRSSTVASILRTAGALGFMGFVLVANPAFGDFVAQPLPFPVPGIMIPRLSDVQILLDYYETHTHRSAEGRALEYGGRASIGEGRVASFGHRAPAVARYSSRGPAAVDGQRNLADVLKPDVLAPGDQVWGAWSPISAGEPIFSGKSFALLSGTSMAAPHVAGIAALVKQRHPSWDASMIASAVSTTASSHDNRGLPVASLQRGPALRRHAAARSSTPFDRGAGLVRPFKALDPGLVFPSGFEDHVGFLCSLPGVDAKLVRAATGRACGSSPPPPPADLNLPSITVSSLKGLQRVRRRVKNVAGAPETYLVAVHPPAGVEVAVRPSSFAVEPQATQELRVDLAVAAAPAGGFTFGEIVLVGSLDHVVRVPLSTLPVSV